MIVFHTIRYQNFLSVGQHWVEVQLDKTPIALIVGLNGSGKSSLLDALTFVLFNKPFRSINKPQLINSITKKNMTVEIDFSIGSNKYKVIRGMKQTAGKPQTFDIFQNDVLINQDANSRDYQQYLEKQILRLSYKSFCQVVILGSASFIPFMDLPAASRREIIEDLLDLHIFTTMNGLLKDKLVGIENFRKQKDNERVLVQAKIDLVKEHAESVQEDNKKIMQIKQDRIEVIQTEILTLRNRSNGLDVEIKELLKQFEPRAKLVEKIQKLDTMEMKIHNKIGSLKKGITFYQSHDNCPTCSQEIGARFKQDILKEKTSQLKDTEDGLVKLVERRFPLEQENKRLAELDLKRGDLNQELINIDYQTNALVFQVSQMQQEIESTQANFMSNTDNKIIELTDQLRVVNADYGEIQEDQIVLEIANLILKDSGIKSKIVKQYIPIINKLINHYLAQMDFFVNFELNEQFEETIKSRYRDIFSYNSFSEGEKLRVNLAILFAWRSIAKMRNSINTNLLIMDEVLDSSLDQNGTDEFLKIVTQLISNSNCFIISHRIDQVADKFDRIIKFEKSNNFSRIVE